MSGMADSITVYGHRIRQARTIRGSAIKPLATMLEIAPSAWTALERSTVSQMPAMQLRMLAVALRVPPEFFRHPPGPPPHRGSLPFPAKQTGRVSGRDPPTSVPARGPHLLAS